MRGLMMVAAMIALAAPAKAVDGNQIYVSCIEKYDQTPFKMFCTGYVIGMREGVGFGAGHALVKSGAADINAPEREIQRAIDRGMGFCIPRGVQNPQIVDVYRKYLVDNPHQRHLAAVAIYVRAMTKHFPCR